jgi:hypothetical protein
MHPAEVAAIFFYATQFTAKWSWMQRSSNQNQEVNASYLPWGAMNWCIK